MPSSNQARLAFASSGIAQGLINNGISYFLLLYYSQVLGLESAMAGLALMIALIFDAMSDPLIGQWSDRLRHRLGRRHPFLYVSIVPVSVSYYLLWAAPELSQTGLFFYLLIMVVTLRISLTAHVVPFNALLPELAPDYEERTMLMNSSYSAMWFFMTIMGIAMYSYWLADGPEYQDGLGVLRKEGYIDAAFITAILIFITLSYSAQVTRKYIPTLSRPPAQVHSLVVLIKQAGDTLKDKNFAVIALSGIFHACAIGTASALWVYMQPYFWGFDSGQISLMLVGNLFSALLAFSILPFLMRGREKKPILITTSVIALFTNCLPVLLSLYDLFPAVGTQLLFYTMFVTGIFQVTLLVITSSLTGSVLADVVDARSVHTGRREEGLLFSVQSFMGKVATGIGVSMAGMILTLVAFPIDVLDADLGADVASNLGRLYACALGFFFTLSIVTLLFFSLDRVAHEKNIALLDAP
jgi:GPH family glycoside/pentoside/hexuronide:cation symporter